MSELPYFVQRIPENVLVKFHKLNNAAIPFSYTREDDACMDVHCLNDFWIAPHETRLIKTGIALEISPGYEGIIRGRSGLASKGFFVHVGTIESSYRGDVGVVMTNLNDYAQLFNAGSRIAQFTVKRVYKVVLKESDTLSETERGTQGYGSSGI